MIRCEFLFFFMVIMRCVEVVWKLLILLCLKMVIVFFLLRLVWKIVFLLLMLCWSRKMFDVGVLKLVVRVVVGLLFVLMMLVIVIV